MDAASLIPKTWYWIRRADGSLAPYVFHKLIADEQGSLAGQFFVGSFLQRFKLNQVVAEAKMVEFSPEPGVETVDPQPLSRS